MRPDFAAAKGWIVILHRLCFRQPKHGTHGPAVTIGHITHVPDDSDDFVDRGIFDLVRAEVLSDRVLVFKEPPGEGLIDHSYLARCRRISLLNGPAPHDLCADRVEKSW